MKRHVVSIKSISSSMRMDGSYHNADINVFDNILHSHSKHKLEEFCTNISTTGRGKRIYALKEEGVPFISNSDMVTQNPLMTCNFMSKKYGFDSTSLLKPGTILTGRVGAIGQTAIVPTFWANNEVMGSDNIIRINVKATELNGFLYAYLASKYGNLTFWKNATGGVQPFITDKMVANLLIPEFPIELKKKADSLIQESLKLRDKAFYLLNEVDSLIYEYTKYDRLTSEDYDYYGPRSNNRKVSCFTVNRKSINVTTINAFNLSERIRKMKSKLNNVVPLSSILVDNDTFSTGSFPRVTVKEGNGIMLINQSDIFDQIIKGKYISTRNIKKSNLVDYGEVLVAGVGTLGESEKFCRVVFANEDLEGQLVSGEFIRMKTNDKVPSGYLYAWLKSEYGFRLIRNTQAGTKLCRPIPKLFNQIPIPIIEENEMIQIDSKVKEAHTILYKANKCEKEAIALIENKIEDWDSNNGD